MPEAAVRPPLVDLENLRRAALGLDGVAVRTPLIPLVALSEQLGVPVRLKAEFLQPIGAFKIRGAWTAISRLDPAVRARGIVTHSSGNHAQAVAFAGKKYGVRTVIVMPKDSPAVKVAGVQSHGAEIVFVERHERAQVCADIAEREGLVLIPPYEHADVIAGQGTLTLEILEEWPAVRALLVQVGGGGLLAGAAAAIVAMGANVELVAVEPEGAAKAAAALRAGAPVTLAAPESVADGLIPPSVGKLPFEVFHEAVSEAVQVSDAEIGAAVKHLHEAVGLRVEPSGAASVAALLSGRYRPTGPVAVIASGGNVDEAVFARLIAG
jgi:threonine dehydratase